MKKVISIFLIILLMLNVLGYYGVFLGLQYKNTVDIKHQLDNDNFNESETVTLKVPLVVPYYSHTDYERVDGEIAYNGEFYRLVKQKLERDTLYIVCVKDLQSKQIKQALTDYVKTFADHPLDSKNIKTIPGFIKDYIPSNFGLCSETDGWSTPFLKGELNESISSLALSINAPPPEA